MLSANPWPSAKLVVASCALWALQGFATAQAVEDFLVEPSGYYLPVSLPPQLGAVQWVELWAKESKGKVIFTGSIRLTSRATPRGFENQQLAAVSLTGDRLEFRSQSKAGIIYSFRGHFLKGGDLKEVAKSREVVLRGTFKKSSNKRELQESDVEFSYTTGG